MVQFVLGGLDSNNIINNSCKHQNFHLSQIPFDPNQVNAYFSSLPVITFLQAALYTNINYERLASHKGFRAAEYVRHFNRKNRVQKYSMT